MEKPSGKVNSAEKLRIWTPSKTPLKYSSASTRSTTMQGFLGGAEIEEIQTGALKLPIDTPENLEVKHHSGVNRTDCPSCYGPAKVVRKLCNFTLDNGDAVKSWVRRNGEPVK